MSLEDMGVHHYHLKATNSAHYMRLGPLLKWLSMYPKKVDTFYLAESSTSGFCNPFRGSISKCSQVICGQFVEWSKEHVVRGKTRK